MTVETRDLRVSISVMADQALEAMSMATGRTKQELVRSILDDWANARIHEARLILKYTRSDGSSGSDVP